MNVQGPISTPPILGRLQPVPLRDAWLSEADSFTPWLAQEDNLALLGETIGIDLELEAQEQSVGPFRADILCKDTITNHWVLIENQLERTDHVHLGQLLTYAAGLDAVTIVWIAAKFTDEHRAALDWLNQKTEEAVNFFGLEIELWRIGDSPPAPKFNIVSKPNDWTAMGAAAVRRVEAGETSATKEQYRAYWEAFRRDLLEHSHLRPPGAPAYHEMDVGLGRTGIVLRARVTTREPWVQAAVVITDPKHDELWFTWLRAQQKEIERELDFPLRWEDPLGVREHRLASRLDGADFRDQSDWPRQHAWLRERLNTLHRVFAPRVKHLPSIKDTTLLESANGPPADADP